MDNHDHPKSVLSNLLRREIDCADSLLVSLKKERALLAGNNPGLIELENNEKLQQIDALQQATMARINFMQAHQMAINDSIEIEQGVDGESEAFLGSLFARLSQLSRDCYAENRQVGQLINRRTQFINRVLDSLSPGTRNPYESTYSENGNLSIR